MFYNKAFNALIKSPTEYLINMARLLKANLKSSGRDLVKAMTPLGQALFNPPSVKGWPGGLDWINTNTLLNRANYISTVTSNRNQTAIDAKALLAGTNVTTPEAVVDLFLKQLGLYDVANSTKKALKNYLLQKEDGSLATEFKLDDATIDKKVRGLIHLILALPDYQTN
jgi:hypothetical protein